MADFDFTFDDFDDLDLDSIDEARRKKQVEREAAGILKQWLTAFADSGKNAGGKYTWLNLPEPITTAYKPGVSKTGDRKLGGMRSIIAKIKELQDDLNVYPVPMSDEAVHDQNENLGDDMGAEDPRYGGFILVNKTFWVNRNKKQVEATPQPESTPES